LLQSTSESRSLDFSFFNFINRHVATIFLAFVTCLLIRHLIIAQPKTKTGIKFEEISSKLSRFSYSLYLTHYPVLCLLLHWGFPISPQLGLIPILYFLLALLISLTVAYLIYLISEKQTERVKKLIKERLKKFSSPA
jgi:peptidoglycan/LPS O-acetylase OafA/YrhL